MNTASMLADSSSKPRNRKGTQADSEVKLVFEGNGIWHDLMVYADHQSAKPVRVGFSAKGDHHS